MGRPLIIKRKRDTSWQAVAEWYKNSMGEHGSYYYQKVIIPNSLKLIQLSSESSVLDLACGEGVLARSIPKGVYYHGIDISDKLIKYARERARSQSYLRFSVGDVSRPLKVKKNDFSHATIILALQNIEDFAGVFKNAYNHLKVDGRFLIVINHPYFRIPRQTSWGIDNTKKLQYRRIDRYLTPLKIPIHMHPGKDPSMITWSFHRPLYQYLNELSSCGFFIEKIEEWISTKQSVGKGSRMENRARLEFPLFMAILAKKF